MTSKEFKESMMETHARPDLKDFFRRAIDDVAGDLDLDLNNKPDYRAELAQVRSAVQKLDRADGLTDASSVWALKKNAVSLLRVAAERFQSRNETTPAAMINQLADVYYNRKGEPVQPHKGFVPPKPF